jgi:hypothetical protein
MDAIQIDTDGEFDSGVVALNGDDWVDILRLNTRGRSLPVSLSAAVSGAALSNLRIAKKAHSDAEDDVLATDAEVAALDGTITVLTCNQAAPHQTASGSRLYMELGVNGAPEIVLQAKGAGASVRTRGTCAYPVDI